MQYQISFEKVYLSNSQQPVKNAYSYYCVLLPTYVFMRKSFNWKLSRMSRINVQNATIFNQNAYILIIWKP